MTCAKTLSDSLISAEVNEDFTEAALALRDKSKLCFCHRVNERWSKAVGETEEETGMAGELLAAVTMFRLNARHLDIRFNDGSRWDEALQTFSG